MKYRILLFNLIVFVGFHSFLHASIPDSNELAIPQSKQQAVSNPSFSDQEWVYLQSKQQINMCIDPDWMPLEAIRDGKHIGMTADYFEVMQEYLPIPIVMVPVDSWPQSIEFAKSRKCDIFSLAMPTTERRTYMDFTNPYLNIPLVLAARMDKPFVDDITSLEGVTLGVVQGYAFGELLRERFPKMLLSDVDSVNQGLQLVVEGKLDGFIGTLATVGYAIQKGFPGELKVAGKFDERWVLGIATRNDEPLLHSIFNEIIASLDQQTHQSILNRWISVKLEQGVDYTIVFKILGLAGLGIILLLFKNYGLRKYSHKLQAQNDEILIQKEKLQETQKQLFFTQHAVDTSVFPILWATQGETLSETFIVHANQAAVSMLGYKSRQLSALSLRELDVGSTEVSWLQSLKDVNKTSGLAIRTAYRCQDQTILPVNLFVSEFKYLNQNYLFLFLVDQTKQLEIEAKLHRSMKMESIGLMAGGVAHDLNNILSGVIGYSDLLLMDLSPTHKMRSSIASIKDSGLRAAAVVADLLTVARGVAAEKHVANLNVLIVEYLQSPEGDSLKALYPQISLLHDFNNDLLNIECSTVHVKKCLMNLVGNAAESIEGEGSVFISTSNIYLENPLASERNLQQGEYVVVSISDTGKGISEENLSRIFEPFYTKKQMGRSGTGIGLAVVWNTLEDHGGTVAVDSNEDGTTFKLYFPATRKEQTPLADTVSIDSLRGHGEAILIIDDENQQQDIATKMLTSLGYSVSSVSSGEEAITYLQRKSVDLIILDMIMDPGINGRETYEQILLIHPQQKAIIVSGYSATEEVDLTQQLGAGTFIKKPYLINQIGQTVQDALR